MLDSCELHHCRLTHHFWHRFLLMLSYHGFWIVHVLAVVWAFVYQARFQRCMQTSPCKDSQLTAFAIFALIWFEALISETWPELVLFGWRLVLSVSMSLRDVKVELDKWPQDKSQVNLTCFPQDFVRLLVAGSHIKLHIYDVIALQTSFGTSDLFYSMKRYIL